MISSAEHTEFCGFPIFWMNFHSYCRKWLNSLFKYITVSVWSLTHPIYFLLTQDRQRAWSCSLLLRSWTDYTRTRMFPVEKLKWCRNIIFTSSLTTETECAAQKKTDGDWDCAAAKTHLKKLRAAKTKTWTNQLKIKYYSVVSFTHWPIVVWLTCNTLQKAFYRNFTKYKSKNNNWSRSSSSSHIFTHTGTHMQVFSPFWAGLLLQSRGRLWRLPPRRHSSTEIHSRLLNGYTPVFNNPQSTLETLFFKDICVCGLVKNMHVLLFKANQNMSSVKTHRHMVYLASRSHRCNHEKNLILWENEIQTSAYHKKSYRLSFTELHINNLLKHIMHDRENRASVKQQNAVQLHTPTKNKKWNVVLGARC